jgi:hypothetical protein
MRAVLIDDADSALAYLSPIGRRLLAPIVAGLREAVLAESLLEGWSVVSHRDFVDWVLALAQDGEAWAIADKVFPVDAITPPRFAVDLHRSWVEAGAEVLQPRLAVELQDPLHTLAPGAPVSLLDDSAYTGQTLRSLLWALAERDARVQRVVLCLSRAAAVEECRARGIPVVCQYQVAPGHDILHFRDFFPLLPFSGRRVYARPPLFLEEGSILEHRLAPAKFEQGAWLHIRGKPILQTNVENHLERALETLARHLGRTPCVADLALLGSAVAIPLVAPDQPVDERMPLRALLQTPRLSEDA